MEVPSNRYILRITLVLIAICTGLSAEVEAAVKIISPTENQIIKSRNQSVLFNCTTNSSSSSGRNFQWLKDNNEIHPVGRKDTPLWSSFELKNFSAQAEGNYVCFYGGSHDSVIVRLASRPKAQNIGVRSPVLPTVDDSPQLQCEASGWPKPRIFWMRNNKSISEINQSHEYEVTPLPTQGDSVSSVASELTIIGIQKEDSGIFSCVATNVVGEDKYPISVRVQDGPTRYKTTVKAAKPKYTAEVGEDAFLICVGEQVEDDVLTFLSWELNGKKLNTSNVHYRATNTFYDQKDGATPKVQMNLTIFEVDHSDEGNYSCVVHSDYVERASDSIRLEVKESGIKLWVIVLISVVSSLLVLTLLVFICIMWQRIKRKKKMAKIYQKYNQDTCEKTFEKDVFVSYSSKDFDWIAQHLSPVFDQNGVKYIIHSRDFKPGKAFYDNMADSVYNSRKVILVMSLNYLASGYCKEEMNMALHRCAARDDGSLIVVKIDNMKPSDIPKSLRHKTFIDFTSREEVGTWQNRILEYVRSTENRLLSVTSEDSADATGMSDTIQLILNAFKLKRKKNRKVSKELTEQAC